MDDLIAFITARLDEDEAAAKAAAAGPWKVAAPSKWVDAPGVGIIAETRHFEDAAHIARHDPARVLREVAAKRVILSQHETRTKGEGHDGRPRCRVCTAVADGRATRFTAPCPTVVALAAVWCDHPDYRQEWRVEH